ncbi:MAG: copper resistance protein CopC [Alphaproteobacteria bacterium]|nr:copper resistance protein CopC [Alphaproteobacteria bacterium]
MYESRRCKVSPIKLLLVVLAVSLGAVTAAWAHAHLQKAEPPIDAVVQTAPGEVRLWFTQKLEPAFSHVQVLDAQGGRVDRDDSQVDASDATVMHVSLKPLGPGAYKVTWRATSVDTHVTEGSHTFTIGDSKS